MCEHVREGVFSTWTYKLGVCMDVRDPTGVGGAGGAELPDPTPQPGTPAPGPAPGPGPAQGAAASSQPQPAAAGAGAGAPHVQGIPTVGHPPPPSAAMTGLVALGNGEVRTLASPGKRLGARIIDVIILSILTMVVAAFGFGGSAALSSTGTDAGIGAAIGTFLATLLLIVILTIVYEVSLTALKGQTVGKMAMGILVVRGDTGALPGWGKSIVRWALPHLMLFIPLIGWLAALATYLSLTWDDRRQGWHDKAAATVVID